MLSKRSRFLIVFLFVASSCATFKKQTKSTSEIIETGKIELEHSFYLIGDGGNAELDSSTMAMGLLRKTLSEATSNATLLFLGDNIYPKGLPAKNSESRILAEHRLNIQIESTDNFKGNTIFIPGNHDWYSDGVKGLKRQQEYVEKHLGKNSFLPKDGCPIKRIDISENIVLIIIDSQWYITNWDNHPTVNDNCEIRTRTLFLEEVRSEIKKARGKTTLIALHHPMFTNGPHGGQYPVSEHLKPLPVLGSIKNLIRETSGLVNADLTNRYYNDLKKNIVAAAQQNDKVIFLSGHEHTLQYLIENNIPQIVSGSGSKTNATRNRNGGQFAYAESGFAILDIYNDGSSNVKFISAKENKIEFQTQVLQPDIKNAKIDYPILAKDSVQKSIFTVEETTHNSTYNFLWGKRYAEDYSVPVAAKVVYIDTLLGGLSPIRKGGGNQSKTLHLKASDGRRYVMRAMKKQATQLIQNGMFKDQYVGDQFKNTYSEKLVQDIFTGSYPYIPFVIGILADAVDLAHLNPKLYYMPKQKALGNFNDEFGDELYLFEEHASDGHKELASGNFTGNIISTMDMIKEIASDESKVIDEQSYIKARLFDMLIGDWDRHQDQWRWLEFKEKGNTIYKPLPRDRDQAFSILSDGIIADAVVRIIPEARSYRKYSTDLKDVEGFNLNSFPLDKAFITNSDKSVWDEQVLLIQTKITDDIIDEAFSAIPKGVNQATIAEIKSMLRIRKNNLQKISDRYFELVNKNAVVIASDKDDYIKVEINEKGEVSISVSRKKGNTITDEYHSRIYYPNQTKEIWVYGLDDDDTYEVIGKSTKIKIRLIGGQNNDTYIVDNGKNIMIYDYKSKQNDVSEAKNAALRLHDNYNINVYDHKKLKNNTNQFLPLLGSNPDDGLKIGAVNTYTTYGFERNPFTSQHNIKGVYYFATNGYDLSYDGEFAKVIGQTNLLIQSNFTSPNFTINFFGYGNETPNNEDELGKDYYRVKYQEFSFAPSIVWTPYGGARLSLGINYESISVDNTEDRFIENNPQLPSYIYDINQFAGIHTKFYFENLDNSAYPTIGMRTSIELGYRSNLEEIDKNFAYIIPAIAFIHKLDAPGRLVLATKFKGHVNFNNDFEFYQAATIGGKDGLRGFRNQRFTGKQSYYQNTDIRYSFNSMKTSILPVKFGIYGSFDYGRVWIDQKNSDKWHHSYGGGFFLNAVELMSVNLGVFNSVDGIRVAFSLGFGL